VSVRLLGGMERCELCSRNASIKACMRACIWYVGVNVPVDVYDLALGCVYGIAHRELYRHTYVRTALRGAP
jgi:hypothetical protein